MDTKTEEKIRIAVDEAIVGKTAIIIAHRLSTIQHADKIIVLEKGKIVEEGTLEKLLKEKKTFYEYWNAQKLKQAA